MKPIFFMLPMALCTVVYAADLRPAPETLQTEGSKAIHATAKTLKSTLMTTMKSEGAIAAISTCHIVAPNLAQEQTNDWKVSRTSEKIRNPDNAADAYEQYLLEEMKHQLKNGAKPDQLIISDMRHGQYVVAKPIMVAKPCLTCHGSNIDAPVAQKLKSLYPNDQATGYSTGDFRGIFIARKPMKIEHR